MCKKNKPLSKEQRPLWSHSTQTKRLDLLSVCGKSFLRTIGSMNLAEQTAQFWSSGWLVNVQLKQVHDDRHDNLDVVEVKLEELEDDLDEDDVEEGSDGEEESDGDEESDGSASIVGQPIDAMIAQIQQALPEYYQGSNNNTKKHGWSVCGSRSPACQHCVT